MSATIVDDLGRVLDLRRASAETWDCVFDALDDAQASEMLTRAHIELVIEEFSFAEGARLDHRARLNRLRPSFSGTADPIVVRLDELGDDLGHNGSGTRGAAAGEQVRVDEAVPAIAGPSVDARPVSVDGSAGGGGDWPVLGHEALHGLVGDFVRLVEPHTEADPVALLVSFLAAFGSVAGNRPHFCISGDRHTARVWPVLVGDTGSGRKGTSLALIREVFGRVDPRWATECQASNVGSGEVVVWAVRDPIYGVNKDGARVLEDPGVDDKRLFVVEGEFVSVLKVSARPGAVLSPMLRQAWDTGDLKHTAKKSPATATGAHITVLGHVTGDELRREMGELDATNGFANRFLFLLVRRSKLLPRGGVVPSADLDAFVTRLTTRIDYARSVGEVEFAESFWAEYEPRYKALSSSASGLAGAVCARGAAYVRRLALIYALMDASSIVDGRHARAAFAVWDYAAASARAIFGASSGDSVRERILASLVERGGGLTKSDVRDLFDRHVSGARTNAVLADLLDEGLVLKRAEATGGRPATRYVLATKAIEATKGAGAGE